MFSQYVEGSTYRGIISFQHPPFKDLEKAPDLSKLTNLSFCFWFFVFFFLLREVIEDSRRKRGNNIISETRNAQTHFNFTETYFKKHFITGIKINRGENGILCATTLSQIKNKLTAVRK